MSDRIVILDTSTHRTVQELLPWFVMDRLSHDESDLVQRHLRLCTQCQADVEWQRKLQAATRPRSNALPDPELALARLRPRLLTRKPRRSASAISRYFQKFWRGSAPWMGWVMAGQAVALAGCIFLLAVRFDNGAAAYRTLGTPGALGTDGTQANVVAMFKPTTTEAELRSILQKNGARIVDGPTVGDFYLLNVPNTQLVQTINTLHAEPAIVLVEPLASGPGERH